MTQKTILFNRKDSKLFFKTLNKRVNKYFNERNISKSGNWKLWIKTFVMFSLLLTPYILISILTIPSWLQNLSFNHHGYRISRSWNECYA